MVDPILDSDMEEVLSLHRGIDERWTGGESLNVIAGYREGLGGHHETMLAGLPGLAALSTSFGADAWDLASLLAVQPQMAGALSLSVRSMSVAELADIVQLILEEEELEQLQQSLDSARLGDQSGAKRSARPVAPARKKTTAPGMRRRINEVRAALARVRALTEIASQKNAATETLEAIGAEQLFDSLSNAALGELPQASLGEDAASGDSMSDASRPVGTTGPAVRGLAGTLRRLARSSRTPASVALLGPAARSVFRDGGVGPQPLQMTASAGFEASAGRALRLAEETAELAMLAPALEPIAAASFADGVESPQQVQASPSQPSVDGGVHQASAAHRAIPAAVLVRQAPAAVARSVARQAAQAGVAARSGASHSSVEWRATAQAAYARATDAQTSGIQTPRAVVARSGASHPSMESRATAQAAFVREIDAQATSPERFASNHLETRSAGTTFQPQGMVLESRFGASPAFGSLQGLSSAVRFASRQLNRRLASLESVGAVSDTPVVRAGVATATDRFEDLLGRRSERAAIVPHLSDWFEAGDRALGGAKTVGLGYQSAETGAGEQLTVGGDDSAFEGSAATTIGADRSVASGASLDLSAVERAPSSPSITPAWLTPASARRAISKAARDLVVFEGSVSSHVASAPENRMAAASQLSPLSSSLFTQLDSESSITGQGSVALDGRPVAASEGVGASLPLGVVGMGAVGMAQRLFGRHLSGLDPVRVAPAFQVDAERLSLGSVVERGLGSERGLWDYLDALGSVAIRGELAADAGAGEWLLPGDAGYDQWLEIAQSRVDDSLPLRPPLGRTLGEKASSPQGTVVAPGEGQKRAAPLLSTVARAQGSRGRVSRPLAHAAAAAIDSVIAAQQHVASGSVARQAQAVAPGVRQSVLDFVAAARDGSIQGVLGLQPGGQSDAMTPWMLRNALDQMPAETRRALRIAGVAESDLVALMPELGGQPLDSVGSPAIAAQLAEGSRPTTSPFSPKAEAVKTLNARGSLKTQGSALVATAVLERVERQRGAIVRAMARPEIRKMLHGLGAGALDVREPQGLKAAMALFGERMETSVEEEAARSFLAGWFGRPEAAPRGRLGLEDMSSEMVSLRTDSADSMTTVGDRATPSMGFESGVSAVDESGAKEVVFSGLTGLAALREMRGADTVDARLLALGDVHEVESGIDSKGAKTQSAGTSSVEDRRSASVKLHQFAPVGLKPGRGLLDRSRRRGARPALVRGTRASRFGGRRVGYGSAALGGGGLVGLTPSRSGQGIENFYGGDFGASRTVARAERLSADVYTRRASRGGAPGRILRPVEQQREQVRGGTLEAGAQGTGAIPQDFSYGDASREFVSPQVAMAAAAEGDLRRQGGTAQAKSMKAGAVARVLSVTATPSANVLPLVAPAARAIASLAAAKPMSESLATSGANATVGSPIDRYGASGGDGAGEDATTDEQGDGLKNELDALAMRIARSVMIRIKRERERRGIHG